MKREFLHLEVKSSHTFGFDSMVRLERLIEKTKESGMKAVAITDENVLHSAIDFYLLAKENGIKPIIGLTLDVYDGSQFQVKAILLAKTHVGYLNLVKLSSIANLRKSAPVHVTREELFSHQEDLVVMLDVEKQLLKKELFKVEQIIKSYQQDMNNEDLYFTVRNYCLPKQKSAIEYMTKAEQDYGIQLVATNDVNFLNQKDSAAREVLQKIQGSKSANSEHQYFKNAVEMSELFTQLPHAITNTAVIAEKCNVTLKLKGEEGFEKRFPNFVVPTDFAPPSSLQGKFDIMPGFKKPQTQYEVLAIAYLCHLAETELVKLFGARLNEAVKERLRYELGVIISKGFANYFLIVQDFMKYARENDIPVGPGRGSAAGSLVSFCLRITDVDPVQYNLMFERFLNPERTDDPDIDIDISTELRYKMYEYAQRKYGFNFTAKVITFNNFGGKASVKDVGKVLGIEAAILDKISGEIAKSVSELAQKKETVLALVKKEPKVSKLLELAAMIEGLPKNRSIHAAGLVLSDRELSEDFPVMVTEDNETGKPILVIQIHKDLLETVGITKIDLLGLRNLDIIDKVKKTILKTRNVDLTHIPLNDSKAFELFQRGETIGVFQMDSREMRETSQKVKPRKIEDIFPLIALWRPGSKDMIPIYAKNRANNEFVIYDMNEVYDEKKKQTVKTFVPFDQDVSVLNPILKETYGVIVFQEQIIRILQTWAGFSVGEADIFRRTISKKKIEAMEEKKHLFIDKAMKMNRDEETTKRLFELIVKFAKYGFNVPHSACYGIFAYNTAYMKANFPLEFMSITLSSLKKEPEKITKYLQEAVRMGVDIKRPNINQPTVEFEVSGDGIAYGLAFIKGFGYAQAQAIVNERNKGEFRSLEDFRMRVKGISEANIVALIKAGAFDEFGSRKMLINSQSTEHKNSLLLVNQVTFDMIPGIGSDNPVHQEVDEFTIEERMNFEKELLNLTHTQHLAQKYATELGSVVEAKNNLNEKNTRWFGGSLVSQKKIKDKNKNEMAFLKFSNGTEDVEVAMFHSQWKQSKENMRMYDMYLIELAQKNGKHSIVSFQEFNERRQVVIDLPLKFAKNTDLMKKFADLIRNQQGVDELIIKMANLEKSYSLFATKTWVNQIEALGIPNENITFNKVRYV